MPAIPQMTKFWKPTEALVFDIFEGKIQPKDFKAKLDQFVADVTS
jgi:maltose-binding protein MalE